MALFCLNFLKDAFILSKKNPKRLTPPPQLMKEYDAR